MEGAEKLTKLEIVYQDQLILGAKSFQENTKLNQLSLRGNKGIVIHDKSFSKLINLEELDMSSCHIHQLSEELLNNLTKLKRLNLYANNLINLPPGLLRSLTRLEELNLNMNMLQTLPQGIFDKMKNLSIVYLNCNHLMYLPDNLLENNKLVSNFNIDNSICYNREPPEHALTLQDSVFSSPQLKQIKISNIQIKKISKDWLKNCSNLSHLTITKSKLYEVPSDMFIHSTNVKNLDLSDNMLTRLPQHVFTGLTGLKNLTLSKNFLQFLNLRLVSDKLEHLDLSNNMLLDTAIGEYSPFEKLKTLNMSDNLISSSRFSNEIGLSALNLELLDLSFNKFTGTVMETSLDMPRNMFIDLSSNSIERVDSTPQKFKAYMLKPKKKMYTVTVKLTHNPIICDCYGSHLKKRLTSNNLSVGVVYQDFRCQSNAMLSETSYSRLNCPFPNWYGHKETKCPQPCTCMYNKHYLRVNIDCKNKSLEDIPKIDHLQISQYSNLEVDLSHNRLTNLSKHNSDQMEVWDKIRTLDISHNRMVNLNPSLLPKNLKHLKINYNKLSEFSNEGISYFEGLYQRNNHTSINLGNNPFKCDCESKPLYGFVKRFKSSLIDDFLNISLACPEAKITLYKSDIADFCLGLEPSMHVFIIFLLILSSVSLAVFTFIAKITTVNAWMFSQPWLRVFYPEDLTDKDRPWDAFIAYTEEDTEFVEKVLYPELVSPKLNKHPCYEVCIPSAHMEVGGLIVDQMKNSLTKSKRFIFVLSEDFVKNKHMNIQFKAALAQSLEDDTARIILLLLNGKELPEDHLSKDLRSYISLNTYLST